MKTQQKFNRRTAEWIDTQKPLVRWERGGVDIEILPLPDSPHNGTTLNIQMSALEAIEFAESLLTAARKRLAREAAAAKG